MGQEEEAREAEAEITCPIDCVREVRTYAEFERVLQEAEQTNTLVLCLLLIRLTGCAYLLSGNHRTSRKANFVRLDKLSVPVERAGFGDIACFVNGSVHADKSHQM